MRPIISSSLALPILLIVWGVIAALIHAAVFGFVLIMNWLMHLPVLGAVLSFIWHDPRAGNGPAPIMIAFIASCVGGYFAAQVAFEKTKVWLPQASLGFIFWGFSIVAALGFVIAPLLSVLADEITFFYWLDATMLGIGSIIGARSFVK